MWQTKRTKYTSLAGDDLLQSHKDTSTPERDCSRRPWLYRAALLVLVLVAIVEPLVLYKASAHMRQDARVQEESENATPVPSRTLMIHQRVPCG
jgi:hypothetical protein